MLHGIMQNPFPSHLSDDQLTAEVNRLARSEREATAALVAHLVEFDSRRLYLGAGCRSLFVYCTEVLHLSEHGTYNRIEAGRAVRQFPVILEMLRDGSLNLATVRILAPHLTSENHRELLAAAHGRSKREVEALVARHFPQPAVPDPRAEAAGSHGSGAAVLAGAAVGTLEPVSGRPDPPPEGPGLATARGGGGWARPTGSPVTSVQAEPEPSSTNPAPLGRARHPSGQRSRRWRPTGTRSASRRARRRTEAPSGPGAARALRPERRRGRRRGPRALGPDRRARSPEARRHRSAPVRAADIAGLSPHPCGGAAERLGAGRRTMRLRRGRRAAVLRPQTAGVPSRPPLRRRRGRQHREHRATVPEPQRLRGRALLRREPAR